MIFRRRWALVMTAPRMSEVGIDSFLNGLSGDVQVGQGVQLESARLNNGDHAAGRGEAVHRKHSQRRRAVEQHNRVVGQGRLLQARSSRSTLCPSR